MGEVAGETVRFGAVFPFVLNALSGQRGVGVRDLDADGGIPFAKEKEPGKVYPCPVL